MPVCNKSRIRGWPLRMEVVRGLGRGVVTTPLAIPFSAWLAYGGWRNGIRCPFYATRAKSPEQGATFQLNSGKRVGDISRRHSSSANLATSAHPCGGVRPIPLIEPLSAPHCPDSRRGFAAEASRRRPQILPARQTGVCARSGCGRAHVVVVSEVGRWWCEWGVSAAMLGVRPLS